MDPLTSSYPMLTPFQFASNSPIVGIDLDGLEYLDYRDAKVELVMGTAFIKLENFSKVFQTSFRRDNPNYGLVFRDSDGTGFGDGEIGNVIRPKTPERKHFRLSNNANDPTHNSSKIELKGANRRAKRQNNRIGAPTITLGSGPSRGAAGAVILLNAINYSLELYVNSQLREDESSLVSQVKDRSVLEINGFFDEEFIFIEAPLNKALKDIETAMSGDDPIIPIENQNVDDLSAITNIVLFGGNGNESEEIKKIGNRIIDDVCDCRRDSEDQKEQH